MTEPPPSAAAPPAVAAPHPGGATTSPAGPPRVLFVTACPFWRDGAGYWARTREVIRALTGRTSLRVVFTAVLEGPLPSAFLAGLGPSVTFDAPLLPPRVPDPERDRLLGVAFNREPYDVVWIDKTELSGHLRLLPDGPTRLVDTHDLLSLRHRSFAEQGLSFPRLVPPITEADERATLALYDAVVCIQPEDREQVTAWLGPGRAVLAEHPTPSVRRELRPHATSIGFMGSQWIANLHGLDWFLRHVWPLAARPGLHLDLYGPICDKLAGVAAPGLRLHGRVPALEAAYDAIDVAINPVRCGAGLKIKSVEALANGLPLVATAEGARGLRDLHGEALLVADTPAEFAAALARLVDDAAERRRLGAHADAIAARRFTPEACFAAVLARIDAAARR